MRTFLNSSILLPQQTVARRTLFRCLSTLIHQLVCLCFAFPENAEGELFSAQGSIEVKRLDGNRSILEQFVKFELKTDLKRNIWIIQDLSNPGRFAFTYRDDFIHRSFSGSAGDYFVVSGQFEQFPIDMDWDHRIIWFAYLARDFLAKHEGKHTIIPSGEPRYDLKLHGCRMTAHWQYVTDTCPKEAEFLFSENLFENSTHLLTLEPMGNVLNQREAQFQSFLQSTTNGELRARFEVSHWKSIDHLRIPQHWTLKEFLFGKLRRIYEGKIDAAAQINELSLPSLPQQATIIDTRVRDVKRGVNSVQYAVLSGNIPELTSDHIQKLLLMASTPQNRTMPPDLRKPRTIFITLIICILLAPFIVSAFLKKHKT